MFGIDGKTAKWILITAIVLVIVIGAVFFIVAGKYNANPATMVFSDDARLYYDGNILLRIGEDGKPDTSADAVYFHALTGYFEKCEPHVLDLGKYGLSGTLGYYRFASKSGKVSLSFPMYDGYERFLSVMDAFTVIYPADDGKKYVMDTSTENSKEPTVYPLYEYSVGTKDVYGTKVQTVSSDGVTGAGIEDNVLTVSFFNSNPETVKTEYRGEKTYDLERFGVYGGKLMMFVNQRHIWISGRNADGKYAFFVFDAYKGEWASCPVPEGAVVSEDMRLFAKWYGEMPFSEKGADEKDKNVYARFFNVVTGKVVSAAFEKDAYKNVRISDVGSKESHLLVYLTPAAGGDEKLYVSSVRDGKNGKLLCLEDLVPDGMTLSDAFFVYDNIVVLNFSGADGKGSCAAYKINF